MVHAMSNPSLLAQDRFTWNIPVLTHVPRSLHERKLSKVTLADERLDVDVWVRPRINWVCLVLRRHVSRAEGRGHRCLCGSGKFSDAAADPGRTCLTAHSRTIRSSPAPRCNGLVGQDQTFNLQNRHRQVRLDDRRETYLRST